MLPGRTGFLVETADAMARAIADSGTIDPEACRAVARARFDESRMIDGYFDLYRRLARKAA